MDVVRVCEGFGRILVGAGRHQQVARIDVNHRVFLIKQIIEEYFLPVLIQSVSKSP